MTALSASPPPPHSEGERQPKRRRIGYACDLCRLKKNRCDGIMITPIQGFLQDLLEDLLLT
jgi:hypothetical protein